MAHSFRLNQGRLWQKFAFGGCLVAFLAFGWMRLEQGASGNVFLPMLVLVPLGTFAFRGGWRKDPMLTLDNTGIRFRAWKRDDPLPWNEIRKIDLLTIGPGDPFIGFFLVDDAPHEFPKNAIRVSQLNVRTMTVYELALDYWRKYGPDTLLRRKAGRPAELEH